MTSPYVLIPQKREHITKEELIQLISHIYHDTKNDLTTILGNIELMRQNRSDPALDHGLAQNSLKGSHFNRILSAIHSLSKGEMSRDRFDIEEVLTPLKEYITDKYEVTPQVYYINGQIPPIENDSAVIYMQVFNFVQNAIESYESTNSSKKTVFIMADTIRIDSERLFFLGANQAQYAPKDLFVRVSVQDAGKGIAEELLKSGKIFEPDFTTRKNGTGVGLSLTELVCHHLHGFCTVESREGKGSTFSLYFPMEYKPRPTEKGEQLLLL